MNRKGFAPIVIILIALGLIAVGAGVYFYVGKVVPPSIKPISSVLPINTQQIVATTTKSFATSSIAITNCIKIACYGAGSSSTVSYDSRPLFDWYEGKVHFSLREVGVGLIPLTPGTPYVDPQKLATHGIDFGEGVLMDNIGNLYPNGSVLFGVLLSYDISGLGNTLPISQTQIPFYMRRLIDERGDLVESNVDPDFLYFGTAVFVIPDDQIVQAGGEYTFTTGGTSNIFFYIKPHADGSLEINREPTNG
ncbi:MAG: hypothetical protein KGJ89_04230 [Patescibacteria group bacterium]|nr:hypothetical protein [Patescibacteria group bacterium]MDE2015330.1 hypothetical protein [Patescibacteria group bacterium]MDE2227135.1 hypothetical protein [Patescibacteria group bacterium]